MLEQIAYEVPRVSEKREITYFEVGDLESLSAVSLYGDKIYDFSDFQFSFHEEDDKITGAKIKLKGLPRDSDNELKLDGYQAAMGDFYARNLGIPVVRDTDKSSSGTNIDTGGFNGFTMNTGSSY